MTDILKAIVEKLKTHKIVKVSKFETSNRDTVFYDDVLSLTLEDNTTIELTLKSYDMTVKKPKATSYYSGYEDLDKKLSKLYSRQIEIEREYSKLNLKPCSKAFKVLQNEHRQITQDIDKLLGIGLQRDIEGPKK